MAHHVNSGAAALAHTLPAMGRNTATAVTAADNIADRLRVSREALGYTQTTLARLIGSPTSLINNFEAGTRRISIDKALALKRATGLTLEWIYTGDITSLPRPLADRIDSVLKKRKS